MLKVLRSIPKNVAGGIWLVLFLSSFALAREHPVLALGSLALSALACDLTRGDDSGRRLSGQDWFAVIVFYVPTLIAIWHIYNSERGNGQFEAYLEAERCTFLRNDVTGAGSGRCDANTGKCDESDTTESVYVCPDGTEMTLAKYKIGLSHGRIK